MQTQQKHFTGEEYLALEAAAESKHEYHDGEIIPMTGGSINHNRITGNVYAFLKYQLRGKGKEVFTCDLRVWIARYRRFIYLDVFVIQGTPILYQNRTDTIINPYLIVEVLSKSTQYYDHTDKFRYYRSIPSFQEYILINQYEYLVEHYSKTDNGAWLLREYETDDAKIFLSALNIELAVADIYEGVDFDMEKLELNGQ